MGAHGSGYKACLRPASSSGGGRRRSGAKGKLARPETTPAVANTVELYTSKTSPQVCISHKVATPAAVRAVRLDGLDIDNGHPDPSVSAQILSRTEADSKAHYAEYVVVLNFYAEDRERDKIELDYILGLLPWTPTGTQ